MKATGKALWVLTLLASAAATACASTVKADRPGTDQDRLTREEILGAEATNLYDVVNRLRPRWLQVRSMRSFSMETEIVVFQNDMLLGNADSLKQLLPDIAFELRYMDGAKAANTLPGLMSGRQVEAAIIVMTRPHGEG